MKEFIDSLAKLRPSVSALADMVWDLHVDLSELSTEDLPEHAAEILDLLRDELDVVDKHFNLFENSFNWHIESFEINNPTQEEKDV